MSATKMLFICSDLNQCYRFHELHSLLFLRFCLWEEKASGEKNVKGQSLITAEEGEDMHGDSMMMVSSCLLFTSYPTFIRQLLMLQWHYDL